MEGHFLCLHVHNSQRYLNRRVYLILLWLCDFRNEYFCFSGWIISRTLMVFRKFCTLCDKQVITLFPGAIRIIMDLSIPSPLIPPSPWAFVIFLSECWKCPTVGSAYMHKIPTVGLLEECKCPTHRSTSSFYFLSSNLKIYISSRTND